MSELLLRRSAIDAPLVEAAAAEHRTATGPSAQVAGLTLELVTDFDSFVRLEHDWNALIDSAERPEHVFQSFNWCWHWCRHYLGDGRQGPDLAIVTGRRNGRLVLLMPFVVERHAGLRELSWLGAPVSQYGDVIAAPEAQATETLVAAWRWTVAETRADVANLRRVRADAVAAPLIAAVGATITATEEAPYLSLADDKTFAGWEERRQPKAKKNRRRQARRLAELGPVAFERHAGTQAAGDLAGQAVRLKRDALDAKAAISLALADDRFQAFFADAAAGLGRPAGVTVMTLTSNGAPAALKILIENEATCFLHVAVFDPAFEKCGAGALLLEHVVETTIGEGRHTLDLLPPRHEYKLDFADGIMAVHDHALAVSTVGWLYARGYLGLRRRAKAMVEAMPAPLRKSLARLLG